MQSYDKSRILVSLMLLMIVTFAFVIILSNNSVLAQFLHSRTLEEITKAISKINKTAYIDVGKEPRGIGVNIYSSNPDKIYVANSEDDTVSVISTDNYTKIKDIPVGDNPYAIGIDVFKNKIYVSNQNSHTISVINGTTDEFIKNIPVGNNPSNIGIAYAYNTQLMSDIEILLSFIWGKIPPGIGTSIYVVNSESETVSVINGTTDEFIKDIPVGIDPDSLDIDVDNNKVYVSSMTSGSISVIDGIRNKFINKIPIGDGFTDIGITNTDKIYLANGQTNTVSVINSTTYEFIKDIPVGDEPWDIGIPPLTDTNRVYVVNRESDTVSVINGTTDEFIKDIHVGDDPRAISIAPLTDTIYVSNFVSDSISLIDYEVNKVVAGVTFRVNPFEAGYIECNKLISPTEQYFYLYDGTNCVARPNDGFEFLSWEENLKDNSTQLITVSRSSSANIFNWIANSFHFLINFFAIEDFFNINSEEPETTLNVTKFGSFTANFKELPTPVPTEYWTGLYTIVLSSIIGWFIPSIVTSITTKRQLKNVDAFHKDITTLWDDKQLNEKDIPSLDKIKRNISNLYSKGKISNEHYDNLNKEISMLYQDIFKKRIDVLNNLPNNKNTENEIEIIKGDIEDAYSKGKLTELHYNLLKEKISELENNKKAPE